MVVSEAVIPQMIRLPLQSLAAAAVAAAVAEQLLQPFACAGCQPALCSLVWHVDLPLLALGEQPCRNLQCKAPQRRSFTAHFVMPSHLPCNRCFCSCLLFPFSHHIHNYCTDHSYDTYQAYQGKIWHTAVGGHFAGLSQICATGNTAALLTSTLFTRSPV